MIGVTQQVKIYLALLQGGLQLMAMMPQLHNLIIISLANFFGLLTVFHFLGHGVRAASVRHTTGTLYSFVC